MFKGLFILLFFVCLFLGFYIDFLTLEKRLKNIKYKKGDLLYHPWSKSKVIVERLATQQEIKKEYPAFCYRPYIAYWVRPIITKFFKQERVLLAESMLDTFYLKRR